jgi:hypothetical protein
VTQRARVDSTPFPVQTVAESVVADGRQHRIGIESLLAGHRLNADLPPVGTLATWHGGRST